LVAHGKYFSEDFDCEIVLKNIMLIVTVSMEKKSFLLDMPAHDSESHTMVISNKAEGTQLEDIVPMRILKLLIPMKFPSLSRRRMVKLINVSFQTDINTLIYTNNVYMCRKW